LNLLLDTQVLLWWLGDDPLLSEQASRAIADGENAVYVSAASAWEMSIKKALGKLDAPDDLAAELESERLEPLPISPQHAWTAGSLPRHHDDPFDRMLVAQANEEGLTLVTADSRIARYDVSILPATR
jgi:PIN domain nuclease of toxin-antitoxin system